MQTLRTFIFYGIVIIIVVVFLYYSEYNVQKLSTKKDESYKVHNIYDDKQQAAETFAELNRRLTVLKEYMKKKYACNVDPTGAASVCNKIVQSGMDSFNMIDRTEQFAENYDQKNMAEISPNNPLGFTSFTEGKGEKIVFCIRDKKTGKIHDMNTLTFVALHEITHIMNEQWGHGIVFWELFSIIIADAAECGIYTPVDYAKTPQIYCGMEINSNPYFMLKKTIH